MYCTAAYGVPISKPVSSLEASRGVSILGDDGSVVDFGVRVEVGSGAWGVDGPKEKWK
jgi:hypothetical protein